MVLAFSFGVDFFHSIIIHLSCITDSGFSLISCVDSSSSSAAAAAFTNPGATLLEIKKSFRNGANALHDWSGDGASLGYCSWRGVLCDNVTFAVRAL